MSYMEVKRVMPDGNVLGIRKVSNAYGWAAFVFDAMTVKYLSERRGAWMGVHFAGRLWGLIDDARLHPCERISLAITFDRAWAAAPDVPRVADALRSFVELNPPGRRVCHLVAVADSLEGGGWLGSDGVAFWGTSVAEDPWMVREENGDEYRPFNVMRDGDAGMLLIDKLEACSDGEKFIHGPARAQAEGGERG